MFDKIVYILSNEYMFIMCWFVSWMEASSLILAGLFLKSIKGKTIDQLREKFTASTIEGAWALHRKGMTIFNAIASVIIAVITIASLICNLLYNRSAFFFGGDGQAVDILFYFACTLYTFQNLCNIRGS